VASDDPRPQRSALGRLRQGVSPATSARASESFPAGDFQVVNGIPRFRARMPDRCAGVLLSLYVASGTISADIALRSHRAAPPGRDSHNDRNGCTDSAEWIVRRAESSSTPRFRRLHPAQFWFPATPSRWAGLELRRPQPGLREDVRAHPRSLAKATWRDNTCGECGLGSASIASP
jgi:hypothetical protein